jgi:hypothetical protein
MFSNTTLPTGNTDHNITQYILINKIKWEFQMFNLYKVTHVCLIQHTTALSNSSIGHNAVCKLWCLHSVEAEEHSVIELTDTDVSRECNGHKNNLMMKALEINLHCFYFFFLAHVKLSIFFETSGSVKPIMQRNFPAATVRYHSQGK